MNTSKVIRFSSEKRHAIGNVSLQGENLREVGRLQYLGMDKEVNGNMEAAVRHRVSVLGILRRVWKGSSLQVRAKMGMFDSIPYSVVWMLGLGSTQEIKEEDKCWK